MEKENEPGNKVALPNQENKDTENKTDKEDKLVASKEVKKEEEITSPEIEEVLKGMPPEVRKTIRMSMFNSTIRGYEHPFIDKFDKEHIHKFLDYSQQDSNNEFTLKKSNRNYTFGYVFLGVALFIFLIVFLLPNNQELFIEFMKLVVVFGGGVGSGYGIKTVVDKRK